ncbi:MAG: hypothetical protein AAF567_01265 [Actinomycetota bacterium]
MKRMQAERWVGAPRGLGTMLVVVLLLSACQGATTVSSEASPTSAPVEPTAVPTEGATSGEDSVAADADAADTDAADSDGGQAETTPVRVDSGQPVTLTWFLGFSPDGRYAYDSSVDPFAGEDGHPCDAPPSDHAIVGIDLAATTEDDFVTFESALEVRGAPYTVELRPDGTGVLETRCGPWDDERQALVPIEIAADGTLVATADPIELYDPITQYAFFNGFVDERTVEFSWTLGDDEDIDNWVSEIRYIDLITGEIVTVRELGFDESRNFRETPAVSPDGRFTYTAIDDPNESVGCEGYGKAVTIAVDDGSGARPVFGPDQPTFASVRDIHFGPDDLVAWTNQCEGPTTLHVGRLLEDGSIVDQHFVDTWEPLDDDRFIEWTGLRLSAQGDVIGLGLEFEDGISTPRFGRFSLDGDPKFVNTGPVRPDVDLDTPLETTLAGTGEWFIGESLGPDPACGGQTLYASTTAGLVRGIDVRSEIPPIVDLDVSQTREVDYGIGPPMQTRAIVVLTECPEDDGVRTLWFGDEPAVPAWGIYLQQATISGVREVISVRETLDGNDVFFSDVAVTIVFDDGTTDEVQLEAVPFGE